MTAGTTQPGPGVPVELVVSRTSSSQRIRSGLLQEAFGSVIWAPGEVTASRSRWAMWSASLMRAKVEPAMVRATSWLRRGDVVMSYSPVKTSAGTPLIPPSGIRPGSSRRRWQAACRFTCLQVERSACRRNSRWTAADSWTRWCSLVLTRHRTRWSA
ncbi:hypothetical protein [Streptomyces sp. bgisy153]|uniref:hypothetical protein n=1 Tax=Streptomyces sp. bgisy153 TaxID=3413793 RepID=UPI003D7551F4